MKFEKNKIEKLISEIEQVSRCNLDTISKLDKKGISLKLTFKVSFSELELNQIGKILKKFYNDRNIIFSFWNIYYDNQVWLSYDFKGDN